MATKPPFLFKGKESAKEEKSEKKMPPKAYASGERKEAKANPKVHGKKKC